MAASQGEIERARAILLAAVIAYHRGEIDNPVSYVEPHLRELAFLLSASREEAEAMVRADRFGRIEKRQIDHRDFLVYLDLLMHFAEVGGSQALLWQAFWVKTLIFYDGTIKDLIANRRWQEYEEFCGRYLEDARRMNAPVYLLRPLVRAALAKLVTGDLKACLRHLDELDAVADVAVDGPGADFVAGTTAEELTAWARQEADVLLRNIQELLWPRQR